MVQAFAAKRANQTFGDAILPGRSRRYWTIAVSHRSDTGGENASIGAVIVAH
jgi:hypothetical protein